MRVMASKFNFCFRSSIQEEMTITHSKFQIQNYLDKCWVCTKNLPDSETELSVWSFESHDSPAVMTLDLGMHSVDMEGTQVLSLYCPFWMLNKTGFTLCYRVSRKYTIFFHEFYLNVFCVYGSTCIGCIFDIFINFIRIYKIYMGLNCSGFEQILDEYFLIHFLVLKGYLKMVILSFFFISCKVLFREN